MWDELKRVYHYPCPCGDRFEITKLDLRDGEDIAKCPSCSLLVRVIYDQVSHHASLPRAHLLGLASSFAVSPRACLSNPPPPHRQ